MGNALLYGLIAGGFILLFGILFLVGIKNKNRKFIYASLLSFIGFVVMAIITAFIVLKSVFSKVDVSVKNTETNAYEGLFKKKPDSCVAILASEMPVVPRLDTRTAIKFTGCAKEIQLLLNQYPYKVSFEKTTTDFTEIDAYSPVSLGDSAWKYYYEIVPGAAIMTIWMSRDSTKVIATLIDD